MDDSLGLMFSAEKRSKFRAFYEKTTEGGDKHENSA
jgi:hypothetical protein